VDGGACRVGVESTIVDLTDEKPRLLRPGGITPQAMADILGDIVIDKAVTASIDGDAVVKAPGMKYRHYAPECKVLIVDGDLPAATAYIRKHFVPGNRVLCFEEELETFADFAPLAYGRESDPDSLMAGLFAALRKIDDPGIGTVFARCPKGSGKNLAVQNRLQKAAGFTVVNARSKHFILGITGGSGCGKTTLLELIREQGGVVFDCDKIYHELLIKDADMLETLVQRFPDAFENGSLNRKKLGQIVFSDSKALADLNKITHSAVKQELLRRFPAAPSLIAIDAIGLFEGELAELCDMTVAVTAPEDVRIRRLIARDGITEEYARKRIHAQHDNAWFREHCDHVLENCGELDAFATKCLAFLRNLAIIEEKP
jgi:L-threonylcarbamoyladenylate synthase